MDLLISTIREKLQRKFIPSSLANAVYKLYLLCSCCLMLMGRASSLTICEGLLHMHRESTMRDPSDLFQDLCRSICQQHLCHALAQHLGIFIAGHLHRRIGPDICPAMWMHHHSIQSQPCLYLLHAAVYDDIFGIE